MKEKQEIKQSYKALYKQGWIGLLTSLAMLGIGLMEKSLFMMTGGAGFSLMFGYGVVYARKQPSDLE